MIVLVGLGERMADRFLPDYLLDLGGGVLAIGLLAGFKNLATACYSLPGGYLSDRLGTKRSLLVFNLVSIAGYLLVVLVPRWPAVIGGAILFLSWSAISLPATMELLAQVLPATKRTMGVSLVSLVRRVPMALGPVAGGVFITYFGLQTGIRLSFGVALLMALVAIVMQQALIADDRAAGTAAPPRSSALTVLREMSPGLRNLLISDVLIRFCEQIPDAFVVVWCTRAIARPVTELQFGYLSAIEMGTAVLCYIPVAHLADRAGKKPFVVLTFIFFTLLKEFGEPTRKALILDLAPENRKAMTFGVYYLIRDVIVSVAAFGGAFLWMKGPAVNLLVACACGLAGTIWFAWRGKDVGRPRA